MGSIREYQKQDGTVTYHAEVRRKGHRPKRASFPTRGMAQSWIASMESAFLGHVCGDKPAIRHNWALKELWELYRQPLPLLLRQARASHEAYHDPVEVQLCHLISVRTGGCSEDCAYCAQSSKYSTPVKPAAMLKVSEVQSIANRAVKQGVSRICLGAAWRGVREGAQFDRVLQMVRGIRELGLEVCCTLGMLSEDQIASLKEAGLFAYSHNLDTSPEYYPKIISTHTYQDRLDTLAIVASSGVSVCCGGIFGMGESTEDRLRLLQTLSGLKPHPESVPLNLLARVQGTPLEECERISTLEYVRLIAIARILMPCAIIRMSAGRSSLVDAEQALCFMAGANSIHVGERLLTVENSKWDQDAALLKQLGLRGRPAFKERAKTEVEASFLSERLEKLKARGVERTLTFRDSSLIDFASNDYLGLASSPDLAKAVELEFSRLVFEEGIRPGIGATGSRLLTGNHLYLEQLEAQIASHHRAESALLFSSGYTANTGLLSCIAQEADALLLDSQVHASTWDGARLSRAKTYVFPHNDLEALERQLGRARESHSELFVCVESLYSMAGDLAPLDSILELCGTYGAWLIVDEAHATGIMGEEGRGLSVDLPDPSRVIASVFTFGKALGCHGAAVVGSAALRSYLINHCRTFIYTTAPMLHTLISIKCIYDRLASLDAERGKLAELVSYFQRAVMHAPLSVRTTNTAIQSIPISGSREVVQVSERLRASRLDVRAIRTPTVRKGSECLRICLHAFNTEPDIDQLVRALLKENEELFVA